MLEKPTPLFSLFFLLLFCSCSDDNNSNPNNSDSDKDNDSPAACSPNEYILESATDTTGSWYVDSVWVDDNGPYLSARELNGEQESAFIWDGETSQVLRQSPSLSPSPLSGRTQAVTVDNQRCAFISGSGVPLQLACEDGSGLLSEEVVDHNYMHPVFLDSSLSVYTSTNSSVTRFEDREGKLVEVEQYISSVTKPMDAIVHAGEPVVCYRGFGAGILVLATRRQADGSGLPPEDDLDFESSLSMPSSQCLLFSGPERFEVLTDTEYLSLDYLDIAFGTPLESQPVDLGGSPLAILRPDDAENSSALVRTGDGAQQNLVLVDLMSGEQRELAQDVGNIQQSQVVFDSDSGALTWSNVVREQEKQRLSLTTVCL